MKVIGVGVDIIKNSRIKKSISSKKFINRIFSNDEIYNSKKTVNKIGYFAKRFAAKEALAKSLGIGFRKGLNFNNISIINDKYGKPKVKMNKKLKNIIYKRFNISKVDIYLSLSDEKRHSIAFVVLSKRWKLIKTLL